MTTIADALQFWIDHGLAHARAHGATNPRVVGYLVNRANEVGYLCVQHPVPEEPGAVVPLIARMTLDESLDATRPCEIRGCSCCAMLPTRAPTTGSSFPYP